MGEPAYASPIFRGGRGYLLASRIQQSVTWPLTIAGTFAESTIMSSSIRILLCSLEDLTPPKRRIHLLQIPPISFRAFWTLGKYSLFRHILSTSMYLKQVMKSKLNQCIVILVKLGVLYWLEFWVCAGIFVILICLFTSNM